MHTHNRRPDNLFAKTYIESGAMAADEHYANTGRLNTKQHSNCVCVYQVQHRLFAQQNLFLLLSWRLEF